MSFSSITFILFFPIVALVYFIIPQRIRYIWLLLASYYFYMGWNAKYALLILTSTIITYLSGLALDFVKKKGYEEPKKVHLMKCCVALSFLSNLFILFYFKYTQFFYDLLRNCVNVFHAGMPEHQFDILLPVGISFYTFQALSYTMDVYRDDIYAEKNFFKYALFVSFFPQLVAGPIERSKNLLVQINEEHKFNFQNLKIGYLTMLWGYFLKLVLADRLAVIVDPIFAEPETYGGFYLILGIFLFSIQIYCDFNGYTMIARGTAKIMGFELMENFDAPFLSESISDLWRRWHMSLSSWLRDYVYIPLGGSRKGKLRKYYNLLVVCLVSGLWHGASLTYVAWGALNGIFQVVEELLKPVGKKIREFANLNPNAIGNRMIKILFTYCLFNVSLVFFRARSIKEALYIFKSMITGENPWILFDGAIYDFGISDKKFIVLLLCILILLIVDICKCKKISLIQIYEKQDGWFQCLFLVFLLVFIMIFGYYGPAYDTANFIYFQF